MAVRTKLIVVFILAYLITLIVMLPARLVVSFAPVPNGIELQHVQGTIWNGQIGRVETPDLALNAIQWQLRPLHFFTLRAVADVQIASHRDNPLTGQARVIASMGAIEVIDARFAGNLQEIMALSPVSSPIPLRGALTLQIDEFMLGQPLCEILNGRAQGFNIEGEFNRRWQPLGDYTTNIGCADGRMLVQMPRENLLGLSVDGTVAPTGVDLRIGIAPQAGAPQGLTELLAWLGQPDAEGRRYFNFRL